MTALKQRIATFLDAQAAEAGAARNTILGYGRDLSDFADWLAARGLTLEGVSRDQIIDYLAHCEAEGLARATRARRLSAIRILNSIEQALGYYFATATLLYAVAGVMMTLIAWIGGLPMPALWGLFAFLSSFVPYLGIALMTLSLAVAGFLAHDGLFWALAPALAFFILHAIMENLVTPAVMGRRLEINPFMVFVAIVFWTWMWGAIGAVLAVPLSLIAMTIASEILPQTRVQPKLPG